MVTINFNNAIERTDKAAIFHIGRDWLVWIFGYNEGRWFDGKRVAYKFYEAVKE